MKKIGSIIFIIVFLSICAAPLIGMMLGYENANVEKRTVTIAPSIYTKDGINSEFIHELDDYFTDNFAFRTNLITANAYITGTVFGESVSEKVIIGKDGWLFFSPTLDDYKRVDLLTDNEIYRLYKTLEIQREYLERKGVDFIFAIAPNKASIYGECMPIRYMVIEEQSNADNLYNILKEKEFDFVNLHELLVNQDEQIYHKLDTHWNNKGALLAYNAILDKISRQSGFSFDTHTELMPTLETTWSGDLGGMLYPSANLLDEQLIYALEKEYTSARPIKSLEDMTIKTASASGKLNLLMLRDSFANALIPMMSNEFSEAIYSRAVPYDYNEIITDDIDVVILEIVERNLPELLKQAPLMPGTTVDIKENLLPSNMDISIIIEEEKDYIKMMGFAVPNEYSEDKNYDVYIRISSGDETSIYTPFPISEDGYFDEAGKDNVSFSMLIEKSMIPADSTVDIILFDGLEYSVCTVPNV